MHISHDFTLFFYGLFEIELHMQCCILFVYVHIFKNERIKDFINILRLLSLNYMGYYKIRGETHRARLVC